MTMSDVILKEINLALGSALLVLLVLESIWPGSVLAYLNLNYWLIIWLISAILRLWKK
mgnify:CR=1 FL=1